MCSLFDQLTLCMYTAVYRMYSIIFTMKKEYTYRSHFSVIFLWIVRWFRDGYDAHGSKNQFSRFKKQTCNKQTNQRYISHESWNIQNWAIDRQSERMRRLNCERQSQLGKMARVTYFLSSCDSIWLMLIFFFFSFFFFARFAIATLFHSTRLYGFSQYHSRS